MRQFVHQHPPGPPGDYGVGVHLLESHPPVLDLFAGDDLQIAEGGLGVRALVGLDVADHDVLPAFVLAPVGLREHGVGLADACREAQDQFQSPPARRLLVAP